MVLWNAEVVWRAIAAQNAKRRHPEPILVDGNPDRRSSASTRGALLSSLERPRQARRVDPAPSAAGAARNRGLHDSPAAPPAKRCRGMRRDYRSPASVSRSSAPRSGPSPHRTSADGRCRSEADAWISVAYPFLGPRLPTPGMSGGSAASARAATARSRDDENLSNERPAWEVLPERGRSER